MEIPNDMTSFTELQEFVYRTYYYNCFGTGNYFWNGIRKNPIDRPRIIHLKNDGWKINKIPEFIETNSEDYRQLIKSLSPEEKARFIGKNIYVNLDKKVKETYDKMDNFIITDGGIANILELVDYLNGIAKYTRTTLFWINDHFKEKIPNIPNTEIIEVANQKDLIKLAIGKVKNVAKEG